MCETGILGVIGNTPMIAIEIRNCRFMAKLEYMNIFGSMKDRAAANVILKLLERGVINTETTIIESSSGNFAIALSAVCSALKLKCVCVVDKFLTKTNQNIIEQYGAKLIEIEKPEGNQSYQEKRIETVRKLVETQENIYWTNQYDNVYIQEAYYALAEEITHQCPEVRHIFIPVSTCGTIAGISTWVKCNKPNVKIIAVDTYSSEIFGRRTGTSKFPGMGSRFRPGNLRNAIIDDVVLISDYECIENCQLLLRQGIFAGASSGYAVAAIRKYQANDMNAVAIFPDRGDRYLDSLYDKVWISKNICTQKTALPLDNK